MSDLSNSQLGFFDQGSDIDVEHMRQQTSAHATAVLIQDSLLNITKKAKELGQAINWVKTHKKTEYLDDLLALQHHKSVDVRRRAITTIGEIGSNDEDLITALRGWQQSESDRTAYVALEGVVDKLIRTHSTVDDDDTHTVFTVSEALAIIKQLIGTREYTIEGELSEVRPVRNLYFFGLKDKIDVRINCMLVSYIINTIGFALNEGLRVRVKGSFKMGKDSRIYFDVKRITLTGEGELLRNLTLLDQKLSLEGLYDESRKRTLVSLPQRILLLASPNSAAINDFTKVLAERRSGISIYFLPIKTQGVGAEFDILETLKQATQEIKTHSIQTVVITRGGGSQDDLQLFNSEAVVRAVHGIPVPTVVAIGHERDITLCEKVADLRASTPSNAAELISRSTVEVVGDIRGIMQVIVAQCTHRKNEYLNVTNLLIHKILRTISLEIQSVRHVTQRSDSIFRSLLYRIRGDVDSIMKHIEYGASGYLRQIRIGIPQLSSTHARIAQGIITDRIQTQQAYHAVVTGLRYYREQVAALVVSLDATLRLLDPRMSLERGYALIWQNERVIESLSMLDKQNSFSLQMADGTITAKADI